MTAKLEELKGISMPRLSWHYERLTEAEHWFLMAQAYLDSAHHLLSEMIENRTPGSFHHAKVAASLLIHGVELYIKAGISQAGKSVPTTHDLDQLFRQFGNLYPGKAFKFSAAIVELVEPSADTPQNEYPRYPTNQSGLLWGSNVHFDLVTWFEQASRLKDDFLRLQPAMKQRYK